LTNKNICIVKTHTTEPIAYLCHRSVCSTLQRNIKRYFIEGYKDIPN